MLLWFEEIGPGAGNGVANEAERKLMRRFPVRASWRALATAVFAAVIIFAVPPLARAQQVVVLVDGQPITELDIEHRAKFTEMSTRKAPARQDVINNLIDESLELREAKRYSIEPTTADINAQFNSIAHNMGVDGDKLVQMLESGGASADTLKDRLRAQMAWAALIRGRYKASLEIADSDVEAQLQLHKSDTPSQVGYEYTVRPILFVVQRGSPDAAFEARKRDADALRVRFVNCSDGISFARGLPEVAVRDAIVKSSADLAQELRDILDKTDIGHLTPPEQTAEGVQMFAVCAKKESKSDAPGLKQIRDEMFEKKFGAKAKHYLEDLRRQALIEYKTTDIDQGKNASKVK
jgi:peptidyl-prolyl cis-trans isomerase SurA